MNILPITEADLHAYVDGRLPLARRAEVEAYLGARPEEAARLQAYAAQNDGLHALFDAVLDEPVPPQPAMSPCLRTGWRDGWQWSMAAGLAIALVSGGAGQPSVGNLAVALHESYPSSANAWHWIYANTTATNISVRLYIVCVPPASPVPASAGVAAAPVLEVTPIPPP